MLLFKYHCPSCCLCWNTQRCSLFGRFQTSVTPFTAEVKATPADSSGTSMLNLSFEFLRCFPGTVILLHSAFPINPHLDVRCLKADTVWCLYMLCAVTQWCIIIVRKVVSLLQQFYNKLPYRANFCNAMDPEIVSSGSQLEVIQFILCLSCTA